MFRILQIEWMKIKNYRTFWILLAITVVSIPAFNYTIYDLTDNSFPKIQGKSILGSPFAFPDVWQSVTWNSSLLFIIPAILIITLNCNEFTFRTHRQNIIDGWSRVQFISVKLLEIVLLSVLTTIIVFFTCIFFGYFSNPVPAGTPVFNDIRFIFFFFIQMLSYSVIAFFISMTVKRAGLSMGIFFVYMVLEQFVVSLFRNKYKQDWVDYLPEEISDRLIPQPYLRKMLSTPEWNRAWENHIPVFLTIAIIYLLLLCFLASFRFRKSDL